MRFGVTVSVLLALSLVLGVSVFAIGFSPVSDEGTETYAQADRDGCPDETAYSSPINESETMFVENGLERGLSYSGDNEVISTEGQAVAGVYAADYNLNTRTDLLLLGNESESVALFCNTGDGFVRTDHLSELNVSPTAALFFDHDNDGYEDLYLLGDERSVFLENVGGSFEASDVGLPDRYESVRGASAADYTGNGCPDLFVIQANDWSQNRPIGHDTLDVSIDEDNGNTNRLFAGDCDGFDETTDEAGIEGEAWSLATSFVDLTNDGYPDIHVANDFNNDVIYLNNQDGTFERRVLPDFTNRNGMSSEVADVTGNGYLDIFVTNIYYETLDEVEYVYGDRLEGNNLLLNQGNGSFVDAAERYGVRDTSGWGWAAVLTDFDNDGTLDLYHAVGDDGGATQQPFWRGTSEGFDRVDGNESGLGVGTTRPVSVLDLENDGGMDILTGVLDDRFRLYENSMERGNYLQIDVVGDGEQTTLGTRVTVRHNSSEQMHIKNSGSDYMSQAPRLLHFGVGDSDTVHIRVDRPDGKIQEFEEVAVNRRISITPDGIED